MCHKLPRCTIGIVPDEGWVTGALVGKPVNQRFMRNFSTKQVWPRGCAVKLCKSNLGEFGHSRLHHSAGLESFLSQTGETSAWMS